MRHGATSVASRARYVRQNGIGGEVRHGVTSGASRETSLKNGYSLQGGAEDGGSII